MSVVEEQDRKIDVNALRAELKVWENQFRRVNGRKAGREDIEKDATIAAKYKLYNKSTRRSHTPARAATPEKSTRSVESRPALKEKTGNGISATPRKTPSKAKRLGGQLGIPSPVKDVEATPAFIRAALGPTPQKDGHVLGIFDVLPGDTPCKADTQEFPEPKDIVNATPSKPTSSTADMTFSKTPQSSGKRFFLQSFVSTPLKRKREDDPETTSSSKRRFATPAFLRRSFPLAKIDEEGNDLAPAIPPFRKRTFGKVRSLSNMIQGLRKQEEQRMDDEWDVLREIEEEQEGAETEQNKPMSRVLVADSQTVDMPLGPDQARESSEESAVEGQGLARKPWKKKGLKRQTRRVNMKPVLHKARKAEELEPESGDEVDIVAETQPQDQASENDVADDVDSDASEGIREGKKPRSDKKGSMAKEKTGEAQEEKGKKTRKFNPNAVSHANFRTLKIKNKNSKGKGGGRRFGRR